MKNLIYLIIVTPILFSCNTDKAVDLVQAKAEAEEMKKSLEAAGAKVTLK